MSNYSNLLFASPSFLDGFARVLDLGGTFIEFNRSVTPAQADFFAMLADWRAVGQDMQTALEAFEQEHPDVEALEKRAKNGPRQLARSVSE